jgi:hypothetical protein
MRQLIAYAVVFLVLAVVAAADDQLGYAAALGAGGGTIALLVGWNRWIRAK